MILPLWQNHDWARLKKETGTEVIWVGSSLMEIHPLFFGKSYGYFPRGPVDQCFDEVAKLAKTYGLIFFRMDPEIEIVVPEKFDWVFSSSPQPEATIFLDLKISEDELLRQMKRKGRYNISLAQKHGVTVKRGKTTSERNELAAQFFKLLQETTIRDGFSGHDLRYYQQFLRFISKSEIFVASLNDAPIAAAIGVMVDHVMIYYYGASSREKKELMAPYLLQWEMIRFAKNSGAEFYDFFGVSPPEAPSHLEKGLRSPRPIIRFLGFRSRSAPLRIPPSAGWLRFAPLVSHLHPWQGVTEFKKKFGGVLKIYHKPKDIIMSRFWYRIYQAVKFARTLF